MDDLKKLEYRVKEKTVYFITRYCEVGDAESAGRCSTEEGEFRDALSAQRAAWALCDWEREVNGIAEGDPRVVYPDPLVYDEPAG